MKTLKNQYEDDLYAALIRAGKLPRRTRRLVDKWWALILQERLDQYKNKGNQ